MTRIVDGVVIVMAAVGVSGLPAGPARGSVVGRVPAAAPLPQVPALAPAAGDASSLASEPVRSEVTGEPSVSCLAATVCAIKQRVRWRTAPWSAAYCRRIAEIVLQEAEREKLSPALLLAVMINESSLDAYASRATMKNNALYARDGGLMGLRCIVDHADRCINGPLRGMRWNDVLKPETNIALGARALAYWRDAGGIVESTTRVRQPSGEVVTRKSYRRCPHKDHAYWAHYNHGERYINHGPARHYPHRIGVLYYALARAMNLDTSTLTSMPLSVSDAGRRPRTADRPVEPRHVALCRSISSIGPVCQDVLTAGHDRAATQSAHYSSKATSATDGLASPPTVTAAELPPPRW